jgi:hypothetical protein
MLKLRSLSVAVSIALAGVFLASCACSTTGPIVAPAPTTPGKAVEAFYKANTKHGTLTFISGKEQKEDKLEYWFEGDRYRLTWFNADGSVRLHMISPDGTAVYNCYAAEQESKLSYVQAEFHQSIFNGPKGWTLGAGVTEGGLTAYTYTAKRLWNIEGSSQNFYLEDLVIYADSARIVKTVARTASDTPATPADLVASRYEFDPPELGVSIPSEKFELPWKVVPAD